MAGILSFLLILQNIQSSEALRFSHVAEHGYDTSCGLSVLSNLVSRYWNCPVSEETFLAEWLFLHQQRVEESASQTITNELYAISFKDMQELLALHGFVSKGFRFTYSQLIKAANTYAPIVIHKNPEGVPIRCFISMSMLKKLQHLEQILSDLFYSYRIRGLRTVQDSVVPSRTAGLPR